MARERSAIELWELYVPKVDDERQIFVENESSALCMELRHLTKRERDHYSTIASRAGKSIESRQRAESAMQELFESHVRNVRNYKIGEMQIQTGLDLYEHGEEDIKTDVTLALFDRGHLEDGLAKKLRSLSASCCSQQKSNAGGDVRPAIQQSAQTTQGIQTPKILSSDWPTLTNDGIEIATAPATSPLRSAGRI